MPLLKITTTQTRTLTIAIRMNREQYKKIEHYIITNNMSAMKIDEYLLEK